MTIQFAEIDLLSSTASDYSVELAIDERVYNYFYSHKRKLIRVHQGSMATAFKAYLMKKIPKLLLKHDKEYCKADVYHLDEDDDDEEDDRSNVSEKKNGVPKPNIKKESFYSDKEARDYYEELKMINNIGPDDDDGLSKQ